MKKHRRIVFLGLAVAMLALAVWFALRSREPVYQGKKLSAWLPLLLRVGSAITPDQEHAMDAVKQAGTNAIPLLLEMLCTKDSTLTKKVADWLRDKLDWQLDIPHTAERRASAILGFFILGEIAESAIPVLALETTNSAPDVANGAMKALSVIGTTNCLSALASLLTNADKTIQNRATYRMAELRSNAKGTIPMFFARLQEDDPLVRAGAAYVLGNIGLEPDSVVPALTPKLEDADASVAAAAASGLGSFGIDAVSASSALEKAARHPDQKVRKAALTALIRIQCEMRDGGIIRGPKAEQRIALVFTGHEFAEASDTILNELEYHGAKASFFLTGDFVANHRFATQIQRMTNDSHYIGPHSDKHLLYCDWTDRNRTLIRRHEFWFDLIVNLRKIEGYTEKFTDPDYFLPPYEHYNRQIADWTKEMELILINFTPGTRSNADYTGEADTNFVSSQAIFDSIVKKEREDPHGLNGFILLFHLGSGPGRKDKFHYRFGELLDYLAGRGYQFVRVDELLEPKPEVTPSSESPQSPTEARPGDGK